MGRVISEQNIRSFEEDGYLLVRNLLDAPVDLRPLMEAQEALVDALAAIYETEVNRSPPAPHVDRSLGGRLASLLGSSGGDALYHLAPVLNVFSARFRVRSDLPSAQLPELFGLLRNEKLLDALEALIGPEIYVSPVHHLTLKLSDKHLQVAETIAVTSGQSSPSRTSNYGFEVGRTPWHMDAIACLPDAHDSMIVVAWIPMTRADHELGCLQVLPRSHRLGVRSGPFPDDLIRGAVVVEASPGDVVFMDNKLVHCATRNRSAEEVRWACNFRYLRVGEPTGRPYLPGFVARSRSAPHMELRNPYLWQALWMRALANLSRGELPVPNVTRTSLSRAQAITRRWTAAVPDERGWLRLRDHPMRPRVSMFLRRVLRVLERWLRTVASR